MSRPLLIALCLLAGGCLCPPSQRARWAALKPQVEQSAYAGMIKSAGAFLHGKLVRREIPGIARTEHGTFASSFSFSKVAEVEKLIRRAPPFPQRVIFQVEVQGRAARRYECVVMRSRPEGSWKIERFELPRRAMKN